MNRRAQGISVNVIIIAAIALVIMVLLVTLVLNTGGNINTGVNSCATFGDGVQGQDYSCVVQGETCPEGMQRAPAGRTCMDSTEQNPLDCCVALFS